MTAGLPLVKSALTLLAKRFWFYYAMSQADAAIQKKLYGSETTALTISIE